MDTTNFSEKARFLLEQSSSRYHLVGAWIAIVVNPVFAITDYYNLPEHWKILLVVRLSVSAITFAALLLQKRISLTASALISIPLLLISLQNALTYEFIQIKDVLGQNLNYMALLIGAAMFILWRWIYSVAILIISAVATAYFVGKNPDLSINQFFVNGGLLLIATGIFMAVLIYTRYRLTLKNIIAQIELEESKRAIEAQAHEIKRINENLERMVSERTQDLESKNQRLEEYAFINSHKLRAPLATILGLVGLFSKMKTNSETDEMVDHLKKASTSLDEVVRGIAKSINDERERTK